MSVAANVHLCLNGHTITKTGDAGSVFFVETGASFSVCDCAAVWDGDAYTSGKITGGKGDISNANKNSGGGICTQGPLALYGGSITGNSAQFGAVSALKRTVDTPIVMYGGRIGGNTSSGYCSELYANNFTMYGGLITTAGSVGDHNFCFGVYLDSSGNGSGDSGVDSILGDARIVLDGTVTNGIREDTGTLVLGPDTEIRATSLQEPLLTDVVPNTLPDITFGDSQWYLYRTAADGQWLDTAFDQALKDSPYVELQENPALKETIPDITWAHSMRYDDTTEQRLDISGQMPHDAGTLTFRGGVAETTGSAEAAWSVSSSGVVRVTITNGAPGDSITLSVIVHSRAYLDTTVKVVITLTDGNLVEVTIPGQAPVKYTSFAEAWNAAIAADQATVKLLGACRAKDGSFGTGVGFGFGEADIDGDGSADNSGNVFVPTYKTVTLDLNGHPLDRGLTEATDFGFTVGVLGSLIVKDSSEPKNGSITGGWNSGAGEVTVAVLCSDGKTHRPETNGGGVCVMYGGSVALESGTISRNTAVWGGGAYLDDYASFTMKGGSISENSAPDYSGGGVFLGRFSDKFTMKGGTISHNTAYSGGGVYIYGGEFILDDGSITNNKACSPQYGGLGGGVFISGTKPVFTMNGGTISDNLAEGGGSSGFAWGGGIYSNGGYGSEPTLNLKGGEITNNRAVADNMSEAKGGGVYLSFSDSSSVPIERQTVNVSGSIRIMGNFAGETENNLHLSYYSKYYYHTLKVTAPLTDGACIGVTANTSPTAVEGGKLYITKIADQEDYSQYFVPDDSDLNVYTDGDNKLFLAVGPHITSDDGNTLKITLPEGFESGSYVVVARYQAGGKASRITILKPADFAGGFATVASAGAAFVKVFVLDPSCAPLYPGASWRN